MNKLPENPLTMIGLTIIAIIIFVGGWFLLNIFLASYLDLPGSRASFKDISETSLIAEPAVRLGAELCGECHPQILEEWSQSEHRTVDCENCHDPGGPHANLHIHQTIYDSKTLCVPCHEKTGYGPVDFPQVDSQEHSQGLPCTQCHNPTCPDVGGAPLSIHTVYEGVDCRICHGSQGFHPAPSDHEQRPIESCIYCHKQGGDS